MTVKFNNQDNLYVWVGIPEHQSLIKLLDPYRTKSWHYAVTENTDLALDQLEWVEVPVLR